jgi:uncharacterized protein YegJ (DUF2314 family)
MVAIIASRPAGSMAVAGFPQVATEKRHRALQSRHSRGDEPSTGTVQPSGDLSRHLGMEEPMRSKMLPWLIAAACVAAGIVPGRTQGLLEKAERDEIALVAKDDPTMAAAMRKARATLADFLSAARAPGEGTEGFSVKVAVREGNSAEYFWVIPFEAKAAGRFSGKLNNTPRTVRTVKNGQTLDFSEREIVDWMYFDHGKMKGNYTACALLKTAPKSDVDAFKKRFGLECDL